jgi:hypothetical protein
MNERIQQLAEQCRIETYGVNGELLTFGFDEEKFAELIVRECAEVGSKFSQAHPLDIQYQIKRHFGVEE